jgi:hypothetical protein
MSDKRFSFFNKFSSHIKKNIADVKYFFTIDKEISADFKDFKDKIVSLTSILKYNYKDFIDLSLAGCLDDNLESLQKCRGFRILIPVRLRYFLYIPVNLPVISFI